MSKAFKKLLIVVNTEKGDAAREYVISLDELFDLYSSYQIEYQLTIRKRVEKYNIELNNKIEKLMENSELQNKILKEMKGKNEVQTEILDIFFFQIYSLNYF